MATEYQLLSPNEPNSNHSESSIIIPMVTFTMPRESTSRQERRPPIPWYLDGCKLTKVRPYSFHYCFIFIKYLSFTIY
jgi:hypothetical protein